MFKVLLRCERCHNAYAYFESTHDTDDVMKGMCVHCNATKLREDALARSQAAIAEVDQARGDLLYFVVGYGPVVPPFIDDAATIDPGFDLYYIDNHGVKRPFRLNGDNDGMPEVS